MSLRKNRTHTPRDAAKATRWTCAECGKFCFPSRGEAKQAAANLPRRDGDDSRARPYRCPDSDEWHIGHLPAVVIKGHKSRAEIEKTMDERDRRRRERE